jgi:initiation factor 1A
MVRNEGGGNKMRHLARKHVNGSSQQANKFLRVSLCKEEIYAYVTRILGNSMCMVKCVDGYDRLCHIRGKFTGRSKRENALAQGTWVLIGLRQWDADKEFTRTSSKTDKKVQKCDLLEIYSASEREKLRVQEKIFQDVIIEYNNSDAKNSRDDEFSANSTIEFKDAQTLEYQEIIAQGGKLTKLSAATSYHDIYDQISDSDSDGDDDGDEDDDDDSDDHHHAKPAAAATAAKPAPAPPRSVAINYKSQLEEVNIDDI